MDFFTQLFSELSHPDSWKVILFLFIAFLLGLIPWLLSRGKFRRLREDYDRKSNEYNALNASYNGKVEEVSLKDADIKKLNLEIEELHARIKRLETEKGQLHGDLYSAKETIEKLQAELNAKGDLDARYKADLDALNNQILGLQTKNGELENKVTLGSSKDGEISDLKTKIASLRADLDALRHKNGQLSSDLDASRSRGNQLEADLEALRNTNGQLAADLEDCRSQKVPLATTYEENDEDKAARAQAEVKAALGSKIKSASADEKDDLKRINGVGPFIEKKLNNLGIYTFEQVSQFDDDLSNKVTDAIEFFPGRIQRDDWVGQAKILLGKKLDGTLGDGKKKNPTNSDDLKIVEGIGPKIEQLLKNAGINNWTDLANASVERLQSVLDAAGDRYRIHNPSTWAEQAEMAVKGQWEKLEEYQDYLSGGIDPNKK